MAKPIHETPLASLFPGIASPGSTHRMHKVAGIDFEPNSLQERLFNITVRDCVFENNRGAGVVVSFSPAKDAEPISINFENCKAIT